MSKKDQFLDSMPEDTLERIKTQASGLKWLYEMEVLNSPQLINNLKLNIFYQDKTIKDVELLIDQNTKGILIYIKLSWWGTSFRKARIIMNVEDIINQLLPTYRKRVITDKKIFGMALELAKNQILGGNTNEATNKKFSTTNSNDNNSSIDESGESGNIGLQPASDILPNQEKQENDESQEGVEVKQPNLQSVEKI